MAGIGRAFFEGQDAQRQSALADLALEQQRQQMLSQNKEQSVSEEFRKLQFMNNAGRALLGVPAQQRAAAFQRLIPAANSVGIDAAQFTPDQLTDENLNQLVSSTSAFLQNPQQLTSALQERQALLGALEGAVDQATGKLKPREQLTPSQLSAAIDLGLESRAVGSAAQTIAQTGNVQQVAAVEQALSGAKESGKQEVRLSFEPKIQEAIKVAETQAKEKGEVLTELGRAKAALPGLNEAVGRLRELAPIATSTLSGRAVDSVIKELGFGSTEGATARARFIAIVNNQVLPLLKPTFGGAFTIEEGNQLRATMGSPDSTPEEKLAQLDEFINQKIRDIETKERQLKPESVNGENLIDKLKGLNDYELMSF